MDEVTPEGILESLAKKKRVVSEQVLAEVAALPCMACLAPGPSDAHHITTRGAGGGDTYENCISLCRGHHQEWHQKGGLYMAQRYRSIQGWLEAAERWDILAGKNQLPRSPD